MRSLMAAVAVGLLLSACAVPGESTKEAPEPSQSPPGPCAQLDREWDYQRSEILLLNRGYAYLEIARRAPFVKRFNEMPPKTDRPLPDVIGYFAKPNDKLAILAFVSGGCVTYLEVVNFFKLQDLIRQSEN